MLLSMTGFGEAHRQNDLLAVAVEVRTINSRYFKLTVRCGEGYSALEAQIESVVREYIKRGAVQVSLRIDRAQRPDDYRLNLEVLDGYRRQLDDARRQWHLSDPVRLDSLLALPGVVHENPHIMGDVEADWPLIKETLDAALKNMTIMRTDEGRAMATDLADNCAAIAAGLAQVEGRSPQVSATYRTRLSDRLTKLLNEYQVTLQPGDLVREVGLYAERSDISEEIVRLKSHLDQFNSFLNEKESTGRKLEFLTQEMGRETNTIGSKANDVEISRHVIEMKAVLERIREMIQNVE